MDDLVEDLESDHEDLEGDREDHHDDVVLDAPRGPSQRALREPLGFLGLAVLYVVPEPNHVLLMSYPAFV